MDFTAENYTSGILNFDGIYISVVFLRNSDELYCEVCRDDVKCIATFHKSNYG